MGDQDGSRYEQLLTLVSDLQGDLSRTVSMCQSLRSDNQELKTACERYTEENEVLKKRLADAERHSLEESRGKAEIEDRYDALLKDLRDQLEHKASEMERMQSQMAPPRDLDMLRSQLQEELEGPHRAQLSKMEEDVEKYRQLFFNVRREHEVLRTEFERYTVSQSQEKESTYVAHREVVGGLHNRIDDLRARADDPRPAEEIRSLKRRLEESGVRQTRLRAEAEAAVAARKEAEVAADALRVEVTRIDGELASCQHELQAAREEASRAKTRWQGELQRAKAQCDSATRERDAATREAARLKQAVEQAQERVEEERRQAASDKEQAEAKAQSECDALERSVKELRERVKQAEGEVAEAGRERSAHRAEMEDAERRWEDEKAAALRGRDEELQQAVDKASVAEREAAEQRRQAEDAEERLRAELENAKAEARRVSQEREDLWQQLKEKGAALEVAADKARQRQDEHAQLQGDYRKLQGEHRELIARCKQLREVAEGRGREVADVEDRLARVTADADSARQDLMATVERLQAALEKEKKRSAALRRGLEKERAALGKREAEVVRKAQERFGTYRSKLARSHDRYQRAKEVVRGLQVDRENMRATHAEELNTVVARLREMARTRELALQEGRGHEERGEEGGLAESDQLAELESMLGTLQGLASSARRAPLTEYGTGHSMRAGDDSASAT